MRHEMTGERVTYVLFHGLSERASPQILIKPDLEEKRQHITIEGYLVSPTGQKRLFAVEVHVGNLELNFIGEFTEDELRVDPSQEFRPKDRGHLGENMSLDLGKVKMLGPENIEGTKIGRENDIEVGEIEGPSRATGNPPGIKNG